MNLKYIEEDYAVYVWLVSNEGSRKYTWHRLNPAGKIVYLISENISQNVTDA